MRVVFVCYGNICRSPIAEALLRRAVSERPALQGVVVCSRGVRAQEGRAADPFARAILRDRHQVILDSHRARQFDPAEDADLILTLDRATTALANALAPKGHIVMLGDFARTGEEVGDPYGCGPDAFLACTEQIERLVQAAADRLEEPGR